ncbi:ubiquitin-protein ligase [Nannochloropsis oceanica]
MANKQHPLMQGDRLAKELAAQQARAAARAYVTDKGCMNVSVTERVLNRGTYSGAEAEELAIAAGGGLSIHKDNTLQVLRERELTKKRKEKEAQSEAALKAKLMKQQEDFRREKAAGGTKANSEVEGGQGGQGGKKKIEEETPLPPGWEAVLDPGGSGDSYYWHPATNATTWTKPVGAVPAAATVATATSINKDARSNGLGGSTATTTTSTIAALGAVVGGAGEGGVGGHSAVTSNLPPGWKEVKHAATGQVVYVHEASNMKRWSKPTAADNLSSDIQQTRQAHADAARQEKQQQQQQEQQRSSGGGKNKKRGREGVEEVDPMDPTGGKGGGGWSQGLGGGNDRMADSTAGGSLWQQRPLPAPGAVLRKQGGGGRGGGGGHQQGPTWRRNHHYYFKTTMKVTTLSAALGAAALALLSFSATTAMLLDTPALGQKQHQMFQYLDAARQGEQGQQGVAGNTRACERFVRDKAVETDLLEVISGFYNADVNAMFA